MEIAQHTKKKILLLITKSNFGGAQRYVLDIASNLPRDRFAVAVALGGDGPLVAKLKDAGIRVIPIPGLQRDISLRKELLSVFNIARIIRAERPDVIHVNSSKAGLIGSVLGRVLGVPRVIYTSHGWAFNEDRPLIVRFLFGFFHWLTIVSSHATITVSDALRQQMRWPFTARKMVTIRNGGQLPAFLDRTIARQKLMELVPALHAYHDDTWTVTIGELHPTKQHDIAIEAIGQLVTDFPTLRHVIVSDGEERARLTSLINERGLTEHVFLAGYVADAPIYLKAFDLFILASRSEALGYVVLEAAQAELPIVASNVGGIPEVVENGSEATLVPAGDIMALRDAIARYLTDPDLARAHAALAKRHSERFTINSMVAPTIALYETPSR